LSGAAAEIDGGEVIYVVDPDGKLFIIHAMPVRVRH
jgi:hypothetical protein